jgi:hypothetical protein
MLASMGYLCFEAATLPTQTGLHLVCFCVDASVRPSLVEKESYLCDK